jgi:hypothetical protein
MLPQPDGHVACMSIAGSAPVLLPPPDCQEDREQELQAGKQDALFVFEQEVQRLWAVHRSTTSISTSETYVDALCMQAQRMSMRQIMSRLVLEVCCWLECNPVLDPYVV